MKFTPGVDRTRVHPRLWQFLAYLDQVISAWTTEMEITVTSLRRAYVPGKKTHHAAAPVDRSVDLVPGRLEDDVYFVRAADIRRWALDKAGPNAAAAFCREIQHQYGEQIGVVLEPEWLTDAEIAARGITRDQVAPHIHFQLKMPIRWTPF